MSQLFVSLWMQIQKLKKSKNTIWRIRAASVYFHGKTCRMHFASRQHLKRETAWIKVVFCSKRIWITNATGGSDENPRKCVISSFWKNNTHESNLLSLKSDRHDLCTHCCRVRKGAGSQSVVSCVTTISLVGSNSKVFMGASAKLRLGYLVL